MFTVALHLHKRDCNEQCIYTKIYQVHTVEKKTKMRKLEAEHNSPIEKIPSCRSGSNVKATSATARIIKIKKLKVIQIAISLEFCNSFLVTTDRFRKAKTTANT